MTQYNLMQFKKLKIKTGPKHYYAGLKKNINIMSGCQYNLEDNNN